MEVPVWWHYCKIFTIFRHLQDIRKSNQNAKSFILKMMGKVKKKKKNLRHSTVNVY